MMMRRGALLPVLAFLLTVVVMAPQHTAASTAVMQLTSKNFIQLVKNPTSTTAYFVKFYAPWCGHCKKMQPVWEQLAASVTSKSVVIAEINCDDNKATCKEHGARGYPTLILFRNRGTTAIPYRAKRELAHFKLFLDSHDVLAPPSIKLSYFNTRGRAELIRLTLEAAGLDYEQEQYQDRKQWMQAKKDGIESGRLPFGQVPGLRYNEKYMVQTGAIVRFLGRKHGLYPEAVDEAYEVDKILGAYDDFRGRYGRLLYSSNFQELVQDYKTTTMPEWLGYFETAMSKQLMRGMLYMTGRTLTVADLAVFDLLNVHLAIDKDCLKPFPKLAMLRRKVAKNPVVAQYLQSDRRPTFQAGPSAFFDNKDNPPEEEVRFD